jgi:hypothetical protein
MAVRDHIDAAEPDEQHCSEISLHIQSYAGALYIISKLYVKNHTMPNICADWNEINNRIPTREKTSQKEYDRVVMVQPNTT